MTGVHDQGQYGDLGQQRGDFGVAIGAEVSRRVLGRGRDALQIVEPVGLFLGAAAGNELRGEQLAERGILLPPARAASGSASRRRHVLVGLRSRPLPPAHGVTAEQHQARHALGMPDRIGRPIRRSPLRDADQDEVGRSLPRRPRFRDRPRKRSNDTSGDLAVRQASCLAHRSGSRCDRATIRDRGIRIGLSKSASRCVIQGAGLDDRRPLSGPGIGQLDARPWSDRSGSPAARRRSAAGRLRHSQTSRCPAAT